VVIADGPKWTDVVQALFTAFGALAVVVAGLALRHDMRARQQEQRDAEAAQARLVTCRFPRQGGRKDINGPYIAIEVANDSLLPIRHISVSVAARAKPSKPELARRQDYLGPNESGEVAWRSVPAEVLQDPGAALPAWLVIIQFTDATGLVWERVDNGPPRRVIEIVGGSGPHSSLLHRLGAWLQRR
jgi:hypothetical protein